MTKEALLQGILKLPTIEVGVVAADEEIIEGDQGNVHYKMTKEKKSIFDKFAFIVFSLSTSGPKEERLAFIDDVSATLGEPIEIRELPELPGIHFAFWEAGAVEEKLNK